MEIPTGYNFQVSGEVIKEHECPICLMLIKNAIELPCSHLMCKLCLIYYEDTTLSFNEKAKLLCSVCQREYTKLQKKEFKSLDRIIQTSLKVKCKQEESGCGWLGSIADYKDHEKSCKHLIISCEYEGCPIKVQRKEMNKHLEECNYHPQPCQYCNEVLLKTRMKEHLVKCPLHPAICKNIGCMKMMKRSELDKHYLEECDYEFVACVYSEVGCNTQVRRVDFGDHNNVSVQQHMLLLLKSHSKLSTKNEELEKKLNIAEGKIESLKKSEVKKNAVIEEQVKKIENLEIFSNRIANLHCVLAADLKMELNFSYNILFQKYYHRVREWLKQVKEHSEMNDLNCLESLKIAVWNYMGRYLSPSYANRVQQLVFGMEAHYIYSGPKNGYLKVNITGLPSSIYVVTYVDMNRFNQEYHRYLLTTNVAAYVGNNDCLIVALYVGSRHVDEITLLNSKYEQNEKKMKFNKYVRLNNPNEYVIRNSILLKMYY